MRIPQEGLLLRIFVDENDTLHGRPLYEVIVKEAQKLGLAGATVLRGVMGYGATSHIHSARVLRISEDLPMVVEMVDEEENIQKLMPFLDEHVGEGLITMERVRVIMYRHDSKEDDIQDVI
jgi:PII-like signaling protein